MFINRKKELEALGAAYKDSKAQFIVIYGKRRVGKTELVKQFFKNIPHIYFLVPCRQGTGKRTAQASL